MTYQVIALAVMAAVVSIYLSVLSGMCIIGPDGTLVCRTDPPGTGPISPVAVPGTTVYLPFILKLY